MAEEIYQDIVKEWGVADAMPMPLGRLTFTEIEDMACQLSLQLAGLEARGWTVLFWQPSDLSILTIKESNKKRYGLANLGQLVPLHKKDPNQLVLVYPTIYPLPPERCAPELLKMTALPCITHRSASYYSLALLCLELLAPLGLAELRGTKLFYFLERCLMAEPRERMCFYL
jgi:hypothetical protein